jgi:uncharacterized membrane protein YfcA
MLSDPLFYAAAVPAVILVGLAKGGFGSGLGVAGVPIMALAMPPIEAAAIMLPILIVMDIVALIAWWGVYDRRALRMLLPASLAGVAVGWAVAAFVTDAAVRLIVGTCGGFLHAELLAQRQRQGGAGGPQRAQSMVLGRGFRFHQLCQPCRRPPMQMYLLPLRLDPRLLAGTTVLLFAVINAVKLVPYGMLGQFSTAHLAASAVLLPLAPVSTWLGARLVRLVSPQLFYSITYTTLFAVGAKLLWDGAASLF